MTPKEFCEYVIEGKVFLEVSSEDTDHAEQGRYIWPDRYAILVQKAKDAINNLVAEAHRGNCGTQSR